MNNMKETLIALSLSLCVGLGLTSCSQKALPVEGEGYSIEGPISRYIPVDVNVPGCPPRPQAILEGVVLARKMWLKKLGIEE